MGINFNIGGQSYTSHDLKQKLDFATPTFNNWSGARKIHLAEGEDYKYDEILSAVGKALEQTTKSPSLYDNDEIHAILTKLKELKNAGHENTGVFYNFFRRKIPNYFREGNIQKLENKLDSDFPSTEQLKTYVKDNREVFSKEYTKIIINYLDIINTCDFYFVAQIFDLIINQGNKDQLYLLLIKTESSMTQFLSKILEEDQLSNALNKLLPKKINTNTFISLSDSSELFNNIQKVNNYKVLEMIYNIYVHMTEDQRLKSFFGLELKNNEGAISIKNGEKLVNLSEQLRKIY
jgi:hypothetical protein